ncbi:MAG: glycosyltransferase [Luteitalea sp.]|nr:glycosyltransferase [Luteitalea sp.]
MLKVSAFTGGPDVPSARFRVRQYVAALRRHDIHVTERFTRLGRYPPARRWPRPFWAIGSMASRIPAVLASHGSDVTLLQRELLSTFVTLEPFTKSPRLLDVDDAIWLNRRGRYVRRLAAMCDGVVCGNDYLAEHFRQWNSHIDILPTAVDTDVFAPAGAPAKHPGRIGWVGVSANLPNLDLCAPALESVLKRHAGAELWIVCDRPPTSTSLRHVPLRFVPWSPQTELEVVQSLTAGIMPLHDSQWARGKCSFKMLLYMACSVPVVVSPVGMNAQVLNRGSVGFGAQSVRDWEAALDLLVTDHTAATEMGEEGRRVVDREFSVRALTPRLAGILKRAGGMPSEP